MHGGRPVLPLGQRGLSLVSPSLQLGVAPSAVSEQPEHDFFYFTFFGSFYSRKKLKLIENAVYPSLERRMSYISELKCEQSACCAKLYYAS